MSVYVSAAGDNGVKQTPGIGEYCSNYYSGDSAIAILESTATTSSCLACFGQTLQACAWNCGAYCGGTYSSYLAWKSKNIFIYTCSAGCVSTASCTSKPNAFFTGIGTVGDSNSCPFACNSGYVKSGASCISITTAAVTTTTPAPTTQPPTTPTPSTPAGPNGYFTGVGTAGDNKSCPFECSVGYYKSQESYACVNACPTGQYLLNGACVTCKTCDSGYWLSGCTGASAGMCSTCNN